MSLSKRLISTDAAGAADGSANFSPVIYTGDGGVQSISSLSFSPDMVWIKKRSSATSSNHQIQDTVRGIGSSGGAKIIYPDTTDAEASNADTNYFRSFDSNGFTLGGNTYYNGSSETYVAWCWKGGGSASSNSNGSIISQVSANPAAGFSIATYTGNNTQNATVGHGLGIEPKLVIIKRLDVANAWWIPLPILGSNQFMEFSTAVATTDSQYQYTQTTDIFKFTSSSQSAQYNASGGSYVMYSFADITGYQKIGSYSGTGSAGKVVSTGFRPRFVLIKATNYAGFWVMLDDQRTSGTHGKLRLYAQGNFGEDSSKNIEFNATDFTIQDASDDLNGNYDYIYLAIA